MATALVVAAEPGTAAPTGTEAGSALVTAAEGSALLVQSAPDSAEILGRMRSRQREFERTRRRRFPPGSAPSGRCDAVVGRYCYWHEDDADWEPPEEPPEVYRAREALIGDLREAAATLPGSRWLWGQLVRYLVEAEEFREALGAARSCRAEPGWCGSLGGYALHAAGRWPAADSAFGDALARMSRAERCAWEDLSLLLEGAMEDRYGELPCGERHIFERAFWLLADPLYLVPGNDRRTEHLARRVLDRLQEDAASPAGGSWGDDRREILVRFGWPVAWERDVSRSARASPFGSDVIERHAPRGWRFAPPEGALERPAVVEIEDWNLDADRRHTTYAPPYAASFGTLKHSVSVFRRGDSARVVVTYRMDPDSLDDSGEAEALLAILPSVRWRALPGETGESGPGVRSVRPPRGDHAGTPSPLRDHAGTPSPLRDRARGPAGVLDVTAPAGSRWMSVEALSRRSGRAERARYARSPGLSATVAPAISDLLLLSLPPGDSAPEHLESAIPHARPPATARQGERLGLYWEIYGLPHAPGLPALPKEFSLTVTLQKRDRGWLRGIAEGVGLVGGSDPFVRVRWRDRLEPSVAMHPRSVTVTLPRELPEGRYRLEVSARFAGREPLIAARDLEVVRP